MGCGLYLKAERHLSSPVVLRGNVLIEGQACVVGKFQCAPRHLRLLYLDHSFEYVLDLLICFQSPHGRTDVMSLLRLRYKMTLTFIFLDVVSLSILCLS